MTLLFDPGLHQYQLDGVLVPSVTEILEPITRDSYRGVDPDVLARAAWLGRAVHRLIELDSHSELDEDALDLELVPYLRMWRHFRATSGFVPVLSEARVHSRRYGYAGTLDLFGTKVNRLALIDAKRTALVPRSVGPQTAGYELALRESHPDVVATAAKAVGWTHSTPPPIDRYALHLTPERWRLERQPDPADARVFLACATLTAWRKAA